MKFPSYETYADINHPWFPKAPSHWHLSRLKYLFELIKEPADEQDEIVTCFRDGEVTLRKNRREDGFTNALKEIGYQHVEVNDLVIHAMDAFAGAIGVSDSPGKSSPVYSVCRPIRGLSNSKYFAKLLRHMALSGFVESLAKGIRERSTDFRWADAGNIKLPVPPIAEQQKIVQFLDYETAKIDALIHEQKRLIELLKEKRQAVISHAVTKGLNPDVPKKDSGVEWLGEVPAHWVVSKVKYEFVNLDSKRRPLSAEERGRMQGDFDYYGASGVIDHVNNFLFDEPLVIVSEDGANLLMRNKKISFVATGKYWVNNHAHILRPTRDNLVTYWSHLIELSDITNFVTGSAQPKLTSEALGELPIAFPESEKERLEIYRFIEFQLKGIDSLLEESSLTNKLLQERRSALISAAVTGKIDVRDWQPPAGSDTVDSNASVQTERHYG